MVTQAQLNKAIQKKNSATLSVAQIEGLIKGHSTTPLDKFQANVYKQKLDELYSDLCGLYDTIFEGCDPAEVPNHEKERADVLAKVMLAQAGVLAIQEQLNPQPQQQQSPAGGGGSGSVAGLRLPKLDLQKFSGDILEWRSFKDLYIASVHQAQMTAAQKMQYLKSLLGPEPLSAIQSIPITDANYPVALKVLLDRYDDNKLLTTSYLKNLFSQPYMKEESASALRKLWDTTIECERNLKALGWPTEHWGIILVHVVSQRLDSESRKLWETQTKSIADLTTAKMETFVKERAQALEAMKTSRKPLEKKPEKNVNPPKKQAAASHMSVKNGCGFCNQDHPSMRCDSFTKLSVPERKALVKKHNMCFNCLGKGHSYNACKSRNCGKCGTKHHTMLHEDNHSGGTIQQTTQVEDKTPAGESSSPSQQQQSVTTHCGGSTADASKVLLATATILIQDGGGSYQRCRALLDPGSQASFVSESCVHRLRLKRKKTELHVTGVSDQSYSTAKSCVDLNISSPRDTNFSAASVAYVLPRVTTLIPTTAVNPTGWRSLLGLELADANYHTPSEVDVLLGADIYYACIKEGIIPSIDGAPTAQQTVFGWVIAGPAHTGDTSSVVCHHTHAISDDLLRKFWELEEVPTASKLTVEEEECERHFVDNHTRDESGRYVVRLPFKGMCKPLGNSYNQARRRFFSLERRLSNNPPLKEQYTAFIGEYLALKHMHEVAVPDLYPEESFCYFLPHQAVVREDSSTTKLRVVFDASAKTSMGNSLNDNLLVGPQCQSDLFSILLRFRQYPIALKADVEKMFRQVNVFPEDQPFQRILWRADPKEPLKQYQLSTVTYGTASAPFLAARAMIQLFMDEESNFPDASEVARRDFYVDDLMTSVPNEALALELQRDLIKMMQRGGFPLRKWCSNSAAVLTAVPPDYREPKLSLSIDADAKEESPIKTLGVQWSASTDIFRFSVKLKEWSTTTRRTVLSDTARLFDPLGWLAPVTVLAKMTFQELWKLDLSWDDDLPDEDQRDSTRNRWLRFRSELPCLEQVVIPRCFSLPKAIVYELCGFSDASEKAYGAVIYMRSISSNREVKVSLVTAKTRVAPTKVISLPKLELCGAELLAKLLKTVKNELTVPISHVHAWTDSTIVLCWLSTDPWKLKTFVCNRVSSIQRQLPREHWKHVRGLENPADPASRGLMPSELVTCALWWKGPSWLSSPQLPQQEEDQPDMDEVVQEFKKTAMVNKVTIVEPIIKRFSTLDKVKRVMAYVLRYIAVKANRCFFAPHSGINLSLVQRDSFVNAPHHGINSSEVTRNSYFNVPHCGIDHSSIKGDLTVSELLNAFYMIVYVVQREVFASEIQCIVDNDPLPRKSKLIGLKPIIDVNGLVRVGGRLAKSDLSYEVKHPLILPRDHPVTSLVLRHYHLSLLHGGPTLMLSTLRQHGIWILQAKQQCRSTTSRCVRCVRHRASTLSQAMADLPGDRLKIGYAFEIAGVDYAGPFLVKQIHGLTRKQWKIYVAVFVCFSTKAVHLEPVRDLTTEAFIATLRRFCSIRGRPSCVYSDNATNFKGASRELQELKKFEEDALVQREITDQGITWKFIPASAPHFGGLWEAAVKSMKRHLVRVVGQNVLKFDEFDTLLHQVSACLNSRPLCPQSADPEDLSYLTPGHFLIMRAPLSLPDPDVSEVPTNRLSNWQDVQQKLQSFWKTWKEDYVHSLQQRNKWQGDQANVKVGDICIIKEDCVKPQLWKMGRIIAIHPGSDGKVRVATVRTDAGEVKRPIVKLCVLPTSG